MAARIIEFDSYHADEGAAREEAQNKLGSESSAVDLRAVSSGPGPGFAAGGPMTHWVFEISP